MKHNLLKFIFVLYSCFLISNSGSAQAFCNNPLGTISPTTSWQYVSHNSLGYYTMNATAGCTYIFTYCSTAPSAYYSGDTYLTISTGATSGALAANDDYCGLGSYLTWTAPSSGAFYLNVGNCCSSSCGSISTRNLGYISTNCSGGISAPSSITATSTSICPGQSVTLTAQGVVGTPYWFTGACSTSGQFSTNTSVTVSPTATTTYFVRNFSNNQWSPTCASITIVVNSAANTPTVSGNLLICNSGSTTLTASGGSTYTWYANSNGTNQLSTNATYTTPTINQTTTYYVQGGAASVPPGTQTFSYTGSIQNWTVPTGVTSLSFTAEGAQGGSGTAGYGVGGLGGRVQGSLSVTPGQALSIYVGQMPLSNIGGFNGGGNGANNTYGRGGGGATDIRIGGVALANRVVVAAGGGGGGTNCFSANQNSGGVGGGGTGGNGYQCNQQTNYVGFGGTQTAGGINLGGLGQTGGLGQGGNGGTTYGGGGGGGYYGGGGGSYGGGGGGSSYALAMVVSNSIVTSGVRTGNGQLTISWSGAGCPSLLVPVTITINPAPILSVSNSTICAGQSATLTATTSVSGGSFTWTPVASSNSSLTVSPTSNTNYTVSYTLSGCSPVNATASITVNPISAISGNTSLCVGATSLLSNSEAPSQTPWTSSNNNVATVDGGGMVTAIAPGTATITYTTSSSCYTSTTVTVGSIPSLNLATTSMACFGVPNGAINLTVTGGTAPYSYSWSNNASTEDITNLSAGSYSVYVSDLFGCYAIGTATITQPSGAVSIVNTVTNVGCIGQTNGSINVSVNGGSAGYNVSWTGVSSGNPSGIEISNTGGSYNISNLGVGSYTLTATDINGCTATSTVSVSQPASLALSTTQVNVLCNGNNTGSINLTVAGGTAPYTYAWSNNATIQDPLTLVAGTYTVTVTDANGCTANTSATITQPVAALALSTTQVNVLCNGNNTGSINLTVTGGTAPYTYAWSNNATIQDPLNLSSGSYTVTVTDANGCTATTSATITQPVAALALSTTQVNVLCNGNNTGSINLTVAGGTAPYTYTWSNNATIQDPLTLVAGTYTVTVTDANGCTATTSATITQPQVALALSTTQVNVLCNGNNTGSINLTVAGGTAPYTYAWSNNATIQDPLTLVAGTYSVTVTDANGCTATTSATITQPAAALALSTTQVNVLCNGNNTGLINLTVTGGTAPYTYAWSNNATIQDPLTLVAGTYTVTVTDANGCTATTSATITQPAAALALSTTQVNVLCNGNNTGSINLTVTGGTAPYTYVWSNNATIQDPQNVTSGTYNVTVTDANGCTATTSATITQPQVALALSTTQVNVLCNGNNTGSINLTVTGGTAPYTYAWSNNATIQDPLTLVSGTYNVTVTDANGCTATTSATITQPAALALSTTQMNVLCNGNNTGSINLTVIGGTAPYTYAWSNNATIQDPLNLSSGTYTVTVTDANGCTATTSATITQPQAALALSTTQVNVLCYGNSSGAVNLTVTGGTGPYTYLWSTNGTVEDPSNMPAGSYNVSVTDLNGCTATTSVSISQPLLGMVLSSTQVNILCNGNSSGSIDLTVTGGTAPYTYLWTNGSLVQDIQNISSGVYSVTVTDGSNCTATTSATITQPALLSLSTTQVNVLCNGNNTGSINLTVAGGTAPYTYAWSNNATVQNPLTLVSGTYTVTVTDANGCAATTSATITQPQVALALSTTQVNVLCNGNNTGSINLTVIGGTAPYTYAWSNASTGEDPLNLSSGTYSVTVTDANGCTATTSATITQPAAALALSTTQVNVLCNGNNTGSINLTVAGGTAPYTYAWSNNATIQDPLTLVAGTYSVTVTDANGCTATTSVTITQPAAALALSTTQVNVLCNGNNTGSINLTVTGGTAPYTYAWSNNATIQDPLTLVAGTYSVTVTDANGCTATTSATITQPAAALALSTTQVNVLCNGNNTGSINLTVTGGTAPYTYAWSNNATIQDPLTLVAGTYSVTVTDANGCTATTSATITQPQVALALSTTQVNVLCNGNNTGSINLTVTGGTAPYTYAWSNNATIQDPLTLVSGTYTVTVTDANGCPATTSATITQPAAALALSTTQVNVLCNGNNTGSINLTVTGGTAPYTYAWSNNATIQDPLTLVAGTYTVTVTDANGCTATTSATITQPQSALALSTTQVNVLCNGTNTGSINLTVTGGTAPYTYSWSNNAIIQDPLTLVAGTYSVTVTDANGCTATTSATITQPAVALALSTTQVNVLCNGNNTGSINLTVTGGTAPYTYAWSNNATIQDPLTLVSGTYTVTVTDANGCTATTSATITQPAAALALSTTQVNVLCNGNNTGSINLTVTGGTAPYTYAWSNNATIQDPLTLVAGTYTVTVTDANGCAATTSATITQPQSALALSTTQVNVLCNGTNTGSINLTVTGGTAPYTYSWSNNAIIQDPLTLVAGTYSVTVTDANGCPATTSATITQPAVALALSTTQVNVLCNGNNTGSINLTVTGGTAPYTYAWSNNATIQDPLNLSSGTYTVTVTDANGCTATTSATITQPASSLALSTTQVNVLCYGNSSGAVNLTVTGGTGPYTYLWSTNGTVEDPTNMPAGSYSVSVTDLNGCIATTSVSISQPLLGMVISSTQVNILCNGNSSGSIDLTVTGGTAPYSYLWSNGSTLQDPQNIPSGVYSVTVTDASNCTSTTSATITQPQAALALSTTQVNVLCNGNNTGSINLTVTGGTAPYTYAWSNNATIQDPLTLVAGTYTVTVTDANGCTATTSATITQPAAALALSTTQVNVLCNGNNTGSINLTVTGGTAPYTYAWSNNATIQDPLTLVAGTYTVTVTDANGCTATASATITQPQSALALSTTQVNVLCNGNNTGSINLTVAGGTAPYTYSWSNNATIQDPLTLVAGTYSVTVTDANGCTATTSVTITQPAAALALSTTQVNVLCNGNNTGSINLTVTGGTAPYTYAWSNNATIQDPLTLVAGTYSVTVTDANGCTATTSATITQPAAALALSTTQVNVLCNGNNTGSINLTVAGGTAPYTYAWSNNATIQDPLTLVAGTYSVTVTDANGCTATTSATITQPAAALALSTTQVNVLCNGNNTGSINLTVTGGTAPYTYAWSNNATIQDPLTLVSGTYTVTVTDANGCTATASATITQPQVALALSTTQVNVLCNGNNTGSINLIVAGGTAPYTYAWSNNATIQDPLTLVAGTYTVTVTDANGCTATTSATITQPQVALTLSTTQVNVLCNGNNTGSINLTVTGGTAPYTYAWSNNATIQDPLTLVAGTYTVTVTDANGCTATTSATITQPAAAIALSTTQVNVLCNGNNTGSINLTVTGGTAPYTYAWSNNATIQDPLNLSSGTYSVTVTDANGCTATTSVTITQPAAAIALSTTQVNVLCNGNNTGSINLTVTGGTAPYTYAWSNNAIIQDPLTLVAGTYTVTVTDANGCTATTSATITQPQSALTVTTQTQNIICPNGTGSINSIPVGGVSPYTYSWTNQATTQNINGLQVGIYTVTVNDFNGCQANASGTIGLSLSPFPVQILNLTGTTILTCSTPSITLQATGGVSYLWSAGSNNTNDTNSVNAPGNYIVNLIDPNGCSISQNITITQNITPPVITFINSPNTNSLDCNTSSINITASGGVSYEWMNTLGTTQSLSVSAPGNYGVFVTGANGCLDTGFVTITQAPAPQITANDTTICSGQTAILIPTYSPAGGTYTWSTGPSSSSLAVTPMITTLYGLTYTWNGCSVQEDITVTVIQTPSINIANPTICMGDSTTITAIPDILGGDFLWNNGDTTNNLIVNPSINTQYNVQYVVNGCSTSATSAVTVNPIPTVSVNPTTVCQGLAATLTAASNLPGGSYVWSQGGTASSITETPQTTTSYSVIYSLNGCSSAQASAIVTVNPLPQVILIADTTTGCVPATINFQANTTGQQAIYTWSSNGAASQSGQSVNMTFVSGGCYDVTLSATMNGCSNSTTSANYICVQDMPLASFGSSVDAITESPQTVSFFNESIGASSYIWNFGNGTLSNEFNPIQSFNSSSSEVNVILYAYTSMGCMDSVSKVFEINPGEIYYIPNTFTPDGDKHNQTFKPIFTSGIDFNNYSMLIYNRWGTVVFETHDVAVGWDGSFGNEGLDAQTGVYTYSIVIKMRETDERKIIAGHVNLLR